jgi:hypothetical protein
MWVRGHTSGMYAEFIVIIELMVIQAKVKNVGSFVNERIGWN